MSDMYIIWSHEHNAWWGDNRCGYVENVNSAGHYTPEEAADIVFNKVPAGQDVAIPAAYAINYLRGGHIFGINEKVLIRQRRIHGVEQ